MHTGDKCTQNLSQKTQRLFEHIEINGIMLKKTDFKEQNGGLSNFSRLKAKFTLTYRLTDNKVINQDNLLKLHSTFLKMLLAYYHKQVHILLNNFH